MNLRNLPFFSFLLLTSMIVAQTDSVNITDFGGVATERGIAIAWVTNGESNIERFVLERSLDAIEFETINTIRPYTEGKEIRNYYYNDNNIFREQVYYRITTEFASTATNQSMIIAVGRSNMNDRAPIMVYPTITNHSINIIKNTNENMPGTRLRIFDLSGHLLMDKAVEDDFLVETVNVSDYVVGAYIVELYQGQFAHKVKFIKQY